MGGRTTILIVGEDPGICKLARPLGFRAVCTDQPHAALAKAREMSPSVVLINLPGAAIERQWLRELSQEGCPILLVADPQLSTAILPPRNGEIRIVRRPLSESDLSTTLRSMLKRAVGPAPTLDNVQRRERYVTEYLPFFDHSPTMRAIRAVIEQIADTNTTVLIQGESGVGKELVARAIHCASSLHDKPFIKVNCAALPGELLESELFGHEKGAFTGAYRRKLGKFEFANNGTLLLDEIGELPLALQAKLLQVLQDQEFSRVGGRELIRVDARVIASTNRNLEAALATGQFREDLYYRLNVVEIKVPPLRERPEEIPFLATHFLEKFQRQYRRQVKLPPETLRAFAECPWPGNVRELENMVRRLVVLGNPQQIHAEVLHRQAEAPNQVPRQAASAILPADRSGQELTGLREIARRAAREAERRAIREVLDRVHWNRTQAARLLKISYKTLLAKIADCGLAPKQRRHGS